MTVQELCGEDAEDDAHVCLFLVDETGVVVRFKLDQQAEVQEYGESVPSKLRVDDVYSQLQQREEELSAVNEKLEDIKKRQKQLIQ